jgi:hypothetical protein
VGTIYDYDGTPRSIVFLIFVSYAASVVLAAILVGLVNFSGCLPLTFTMVWDSLALLGAREDHCVDPCAGFHASDFSNGTCREERNWNTCDFCGLSV